METLTPRARFRGEVNPWLDPPSSLTNNEEGSERSTFYFIGNLLPVKLKVLTTGRVHISIIRRFTMNLLHVTEQLLEEADEKYQESLKSSWESVFPELGRIYAPSRLVLLTGTTGAGKSRVALGEALNATRLGKKVLYIHSEMSDIQVCSILRKAWDKRIEGNLDIANIDTFDDFRKLYLETNGFSHYDLIVLDYMDINLMDCTDDIPAYQILNHVMRTFDTIRKDPKFTGCFLILSQLNGRVNERNSLDSLDIAGAKGIERSFDYHFSIAPSALGLQVSVRKDRYCITPADNRNFVATFNYTLLDSLKF